MNIKEINEKIESELGIYPKTELGINLLTFYILSKRVKCNGVYEDYYYHKDCEFPFDGRDATYYHEFETRVYYDPKKDVVVSFCDSESKTFHYYDEYHYDKEKDELIEDRSIYDFSGCSGSEHLLYYKCCKKDVPYFKPIRLEGNLTIDCELKLYSGDKFIASLEDIVTMLNNKNEYEFKDIRKLERLVKGLTINITDLPKPYRNYLTRMSKFELGELELMSGNYGKALEIFKELAESSKRCTLKKIKEI